MTATQREPAELPLPPLELRRIAGPVEPRYYDNPERGLVFPYLPRQAYEKVFDFGCGCGRIARQLIQQDPAPQRYVGIDVDLKAIAWCRENLAPHAAGSSFTRTTSRRRACAPRTGPATAHA